MLTSPAGTDGYRFAQAVLDLVVDLAMTADMLLTFFTASSSSYSHFPCVLSLHILLSPAPCLPIMCETIDSRMAKASLNKPGT